MPASIGLSDLKKGEQYLIFKATTFEAGRNGDLQKRVLRPRMVVVEEIFNNGKRTQVGVALAEPYISPSGPGYRPSELKAWVPYTHLAALDPVSPSSLGVAS